MRRQGLSLIEVLIAIAILGILIAIAYAAISQGLRVQSTQEAVTSTQARLRRVAEVYTQELRSAVLGAVSDHPYTSDEHSVSFTLLDGGAGYQVSAIDVANNRLSVVNDTGPGIAVDGDQVMVVDAGGTAAIFQLASNPQATASAGVFDVVPAGSSCFDGMVAADSTLRNRNALLFRVKTLGLRYDPDDDILYLTEGSAAERPLAFDLSDVTIGYVYREADGTLHVLDGPIRVDGHPARNATIGGEEVELVRLQVQLEGEGRSMAGDVSRNYVSQVDLASNQSFSVKAVSSCS